MYMYDLSSYSREVNEALMSADVVPTSLDVLALKELAQKNLVKVHGIDTSSRNGIPTTYQGTLLLLYDSLNGQCRWVQVEGEITYPPTENLPRLLHPLNEVRIDQVRKDAKGG